MHSFYRTVVVASQYVPSAVKLMMERVLYQWVRVESGLDDPDNLGFEFTFLEGQVGLIHKLNYLDVT